MLCALPRAVAVKDRDGAMPQPPLYSAQNILRKEETHIAIFHCTIKLVQRSKGKSVVAAAAYRSGTKLVNEWDGMTHDYTRKGGVVHAEIMLPAHAPPEFQDRAILWNSVEQIEKSKDSQLAREVEVALPVELSREQQLSLVRTYVKDNFVDNGMCADFAIHDRDTGNPHAHILLTVRPLKGNGAQNAARSMNWMNVVNASQMAEADGKIIEKIRRTGTTKNKLRSGAAHGRIIPIGRWKLPESWNESTTAVISDKAFRKSPRCIWALPRSKWKSAA